MNPQTSFSTTKKNINCQVKIKTVDGNRIGYSGLFPSTIDAAIDAANRFIFANIKVEAVPCQTQN